MTTTILGVPYYNYGILGPKTLILIIITFINCHHLLWSRLVGGGLTTGFGRDFDAGVSGCSGLEVRSLRGLKGLGS